MHTSLRRLALPAALALLAACSGGCAIVTAVGGAMAAAAADEVAAPVTEAATSATRTATREAMGRVGLPTRTTTTATTTTTADAADIPVWPAGTPVATAPIPAAPSANPTDPDAPPAPPADPALAGLLHSGRELDIAIVGAGYLAVLGDDGQPRYTRLGTLTIDADGALAVSCAGTKRRLLPFLSVPPGVTLTTSPDALSVDSYGSVFARTSAGVRELGRLDLVRFAVPEALTRAESTHLYRASAASGPPVSGAAGENGFGYIVSGYLEVAAN